MADLFRPADPGARRVTIIAVLVTALLVTIGARLYYLQVLHKDTPAQTASGGYTGSYVIPALRGQIVDARGVPLVDNRTTQVVTVDRDTLQQQPDHGRAVLGRLATLLGVPVADLNLQITPCAPKVPAPCWTGQPYQPVPVESDASTAVVLALREHTELYPGIAVQTQSVRNYPGGTLAAHLLGYAGAVDGTDEKANPALHDADTIGRAGLEEQYDALLRGVDGSQQVRLDPRGVAVATGRQIAPTVGDTLVTSIDQRVQALAEKALAAQVAAQHRLGRPATSGAVVVMDPNSGRIIAAASYPTYDPQVFVGGISTADYQRLTAPGANDPLVGRAIAGAYAPGSTFKLITASSDVTRGEVSLDGSYPCPSALTIDGRTKTNFDSEGYGYPLTLRQALQVSCDTFFYAPAANEYYADQSRIAAGQQATEYLQKMATAYGVGSRPGVDLPADEQAAGSYADRETRLARWNANKAQYCQDAKTGFPQEKNPTQRAYLTQLAKENCTDGWRYRAGDNADLAIGQGETTMSPLQLAVAYSALVNGGTIYNPTIGWGVVNSAGKLVKTVKPTVKGKLPVSRSVLNYIADSLHFDDGHTVSGALAFDGVPYKTQLGGKTGTAEVEGKDDTSWLASWGPLSTDAQGNPHAKYVVVGMLAETGTGASAAAPMVREVFDGLLGLTLATTLPKVAK